MMLSLDTAYRSFGGEVEASSTPTICRLSDSRRHQLWAIALVATQAAFLSSVTYRCVEGIASRQTIVTATISTSSTRYFVIMIVKVTQRSTGNLVGFLRHCTETDKIVP